MSKNIIEVTDGQLEYLQDLVLFAYEMEVPEQKGWDIQTYDNLVDAVLTNGNVIGEQTVKLVSQDNPIRKSGVL